MPLNKRIDRVKELATLEHGNKPERLKAWVFSMLCEESETFVIYGYRFSFAEVRELYGSF